MADKNHWITPLWLLDMARDFLEGIDLDPMSSKQANRYVCANRFYTQDALELSWKSRTLWLNPPYGRGQFQPAIDKFMGELVARQIPQALVLTNNVTDTRAGRLLLDSCDAVCFPKRIAFVDPDTGLAVRGNDRAQMLTYFGHRGRTFLNRFNGLGPVLLN